MKKKYKVTFLLDKSNLWFEKQLKNYNFRLNSKFIFKISKNPKNIKNQNIVFPLSYTKILPESFLQKNELILIAHSSKLPKDKGFAPLQYQILRNKNKVYMSLIKATKEVDKDKEKPKDIPSESLKSKESAIASPANEKLLASSLSPKEKTTASD